VHVHVKVFAGYCAPRRAAKTAEAFEFVQDNLNRDFESAASFDELVLVAN